MVRVAGLKGQVAAGVATPSQDGLTPAQQLEAINRRAGGLMDEQQRIWRTLREDLRGSGVAVVNGDELTPLEREWLDGYFMADLFPVLTPLAVDPAHPFPFIPNLGFALELQIYRASDNRLLLGLLPLPAQIERFIKLPGSEGRYILLERCIAIFLDRLFPGFELRWMGNFRVIRDSDIEVLEEAEDLVRLFETALKRGRRGPGIRLTIDSTMQKDKQDYVIDQIPVHNLHAFVIRGPPTPA